MQKVKQRIITRNRRLYIVALVLLVIGTISGTTAAQESQWELMLENVHGPIAVDPTDDDVIYVAVRGSTSELSSGMLKSIDGGLTWEHYTEGWQFGSPYDILINPHNPQEILVSGGRGTAVSKSIDGGKTWVRSDKGVPGSSHGSLGYNISYDTRDSTYYLAHDAGGFNGGIFQSKDGENWEKIRHYPGTTAVLIDEDHDVMYAGSMGLAYLMRSTDEGLTWDPKYEGMTRRINHLARVPGSKTIYSATVRGIFKSYDQGENWISVNDTLTEQLNFRGGIAISKTDTNTVIAGSTAAFYLGVHGGIFISRNGGSSWEHEKFEIPDSIKVNNHHMFFDELSNTLYMNNELVYDPDKPTEIHIYRLNDALATDAFDDNNGVIDFPKEIELFQNYPNPFNPVTVIEYALPEPAEVTLRVYDVMGRLVETLVDQMKSPGRYQAAWDATNFASGMYIYRMRAGDFVQSRQMILVK